MNEKHFKIGTIGQYTAGIICGIGLGIELGMGADIGYILITTGALAYSVFTKISEYSKRG